MNVNNITNISSIIIYNKIIDITIKPCFFSYYLLTSLSEYFLGIMELPQFWSILLWICKFLYHSQTNNYLFHCNASLKKNFFVTVKLIEYIFSAVSGCSNPCVGPFPRIKMSFFLLTMRAEELISIPKIITFF